MSSPGVRNVCILACVMASHAGIAQWAGDDLRPTTEERLAEAGVAVTVPDMTAALLDPRSTEELRALAAVGLGRTRDPRVLPTLTQVLLDPESDIRGASAIGLRYLGHRGAVPALRTSLDIDPVIHFRMLSVQALAAIGGEDAVDALLSTVEDEAQDSSVRFQAALVAGNLESATARERLKVLLSSETEDVRTAVALSLGELGDPTALPALIDIALEESTAEWIRAKAMSRIERLIDRQLGYEKPYDAPITEADQAAVLRKLAEWRAAQGPIGQ